MRQVFDWEAVEREFRAGRLSIREIGRQHGVSAAAIVKRAAKRGWVRDLSEEVRKVTRAKVAQLAGDGGFTVNSGKVNTQVNSVNQRARDEQIVEEAATQNTRVIGGHLACAARLKRLVTHSMRLLEIHLGLPPAEKDEQLDQALTQNPPNPMMLFVGKSDGVSNALRSITDGLERIVRLERQALNIDDAPPPADADFAALLTKAKERARNARQGMASESDPDNCLPGDEREEHNPFLH